MNREYWYGIGIGVTIFSMLAFMPVGIAYFTCQETCEVHQGLEITKWILFIMMISGIPSGMISRKLIEMKNNWNPTEIIREKKENGK